MDAEYETMALKVLREEGIIAFAENFEIGRYLSKLGCFDADRELLQFIAPHLSADNALALHSYCKSYRSECEWREQFESIFHHHADALPEPDF